MQIQDVVTAPRSPWQNAYVERFIGSIRRECLDHVIVLSAAGHRVVTVSPDPRHPRRGDRVLGSHSVPRPLTRFDSGRISSFAFSPDGKRLALARGRTTGDVVLIRNLR